MDVSDNSEFRQRLVTVAELFDVKLSPQRQALYFEALRDIDAEFVFGALSEATKRCTFMPKPAEIRRFALGDDEDRAELAWQEWKEAAKLLGSYRSFGTRDAALGEALIAVFGGWPEACTAELSPEMWASKRKEFGRVYHALRQRQLEGPRQLAGWCERDNGARGYLPPAPDVKALEP